MEWNNRSQTSYCLITQSTVLHFIHVVFRYCVIFFTKSVLNLENQQFHVFITIYGENGDTGRRPLLVSKTNSSPFLPNQVDVFYARAVSLGKPLRVVVELISTATSWLPIFDFRDFVGDLSNQ